MAHLLAGQKTEVLRNAKLKLASRPVRRAEEFAARCQAAADAGADAEAAKIRDALTKKMDRLRVSIATAEDRVETARTSASSAKTNEFVGAAGSVLSNLLGGRAIGARHRRRRPGRVVAAGAEPAANRRIEEAENRLGEKTDDLAALEQDLRTRSSRSTTSGRRSRPRSTRAGRPGEDRHPGRRPLRDLAPGGLIAGRRPSRSAPRFSLSSGSRGRRCSPRGAGPSGGRAGPRSTVNNTSVPAAGSPAPGPRRTRRARRPPGSCSPARSAWPRRPVDVAPLEAGVDPVGRVAEGLGLLAGPPSGGVEGGRVAAPPQPQEGEDHHRADLGGPSSRSPVRGRPARPGGPPGGGPVGQDEPGRERDEPEDVAIEDGEGCRCRPPPAPPPRRSRTAGSWPDVEGGERRIATPGTVTDVGTGGSRRWSRATTTSAMVATSVSPSTRAARPPGAAAAATGPSRMSSPSAPRWSR